MDKEVVVVASGYFDPIHVGHLEYLRRAKRLGDKLIVIVNNDEQAVLKKKFVFMPLSERVEILKEFKCVDEVFVSIDSGKSVCDSLEQLNPDIFAKGGDRHADEIPEAEICKEIGCEIIDGLGEKIQSSSGLIKNMENGDSRKKAVENWNKLNILE